MKTRSSLLLFVSLLLGFCSLAGCVAPSLQQTTPPVPQADPFVGRKGCFLLYNLKTQGFEKIMNPENCEERYPACSTFKVPLAVMAFDSGVLKDEKTRLKWNGVKQDREVLNHDHDARSWMQDSVVWFSQRLTPQIGSQKLRKYLKDFNYGNQDMRGGLTKAWLVSPAAPTPALKISAFEQVEWLKKLWRDQLPVSPRSMKLTREIMALEVSPLGFSLSGKTGSNYFDSAKSMHLGWFIGHLIKGEQEYLVVTNFADLAPSAQEGSGGPKAKQITKDLLQLQGLW